MISDRPPSGTVHLWRLKLDAPGELDTDVALLSAAERDRLSLRSDRGARRFARAHADLRRVLATYRGGASDAVDLLAPYGLAPRVIAGDLELSLAHSDDVALVVIATTSVGVDLEAVTVANRAGEDLDAMAELTLSDRELAVFRATPLKERPMFWLRSWTRKEAWIKANGRGVCDQILADVDVTAATLEGHALIDLAPVPGYAGALAVASCSATVTWKELHA